MPLYSRAYLVPALDPDTHRLGRPWIRDRLVILARLRVLPRTASQRVRISSDMHGHWEEHLVSRHPVRQAPALWTYGRPDGPEARVGTMWDLPSVGPLWPCASQPRHIGCHSTGDRLHRSNDAQGGSTVGHRIRQFPVRLSVAAFACALFVMPYVSHVARAAQCNW